MNFHVASTAIQWRSHSKTVPVTSTLDFGAPRASESGASEGSTRPHLKAAAMAIVSELFVYPFKSARGAPKSSVLVTGTGFEWDRHWMAVDAT